MIGVGAMGRNHARVYAEMPEVELVGVADADRATAQAVARRYGTRAYTRLPSSCWRSSAPMR